MNVNIFINNTLAFNNITVEEAHELIKKLEISHEITDIKTMDLRWNNVFLTRKKDESNGRIVARQNPNCIQQTHLLHKGNVLRSTNL